MRNGFGMYWFGAAVAFVSGWFVVRAAGLHRVQSLPSELASHLTAASTNDSARVSFGVAQTPTLQGDALEASIRKITALAARSSEESSRYVKELYEFASRLSAKDFPRVLALLQKSASKKREPLRRELLAYWMEQNATAARAYINAVSPKERQGLMVAEQGFNPLVHAWASADPTGLVAWLRNLPSRERQAIRDSVLPLVANTLAQRDPQTAFALLLESPDAEAGDRGGIEGAIFREWSLRDPAAAAKGAMSLKAGIGRRIALSTSASQWLKADEEAVMTWVREITDPELAREAATVVAGRLTSRSPETALNLLIEQGVTSTPEADYVRLQSYQEWLKRDANSAVASAQQLEPGPSRDAIFATMLPILAADQPQHAAELYKAETARGTSMGNAAQKIVQSFLSSGSTGAALSFLGELPEGEQLRATDTLPFYLLHSKVSPSEVIDIGLQLPPGPVKDRWLKESATYITRERDPAEMQRVLEQLPSGADRDSLTGRTIVEVLRLKANPAAAVALSQTLSNGHQYLTEGIAAWLGSSNPTPARKWLQETRLFTPEEKQQLLQPPSTARNVAPPGTGTRSGSGTGIPRP